MVSIKDIAKALSISPSSVSLVLNGKAKEKRISEALAERIKMAAAEMGYQPNRAAVSLRTGRSGTIGLIVENITNHFFSALAHTIEAEARRLRYNVVYCSAENDAEKGKEVLRLMLNQQVDGYLIVPTPGMEAEIEEVMKAGKPVVLIDRRLPHMALPFVMADSYGGMRQGVDHLINTGNRRIGLVTVDLLLQQMQDRRQAYLDGLQESRIEMKNDWLLSISYDTGKEAAVEAIAAYLQRNSDLEAVVFATNYLGIYGLMALRRLNLQIPQQLRVLCFDDHDIFELYQPAITVVQQPIKQIAQVAMELLAAQLNASATDVEMQNLLPAKLIVRDSA